MPASASDSIAVANVANAEQRAAEHHESDGPGGLPSFGDKPAASSSKRSKIIMGGLIGGAIAAVGAIGYAIFRSQKSSPSRPSGMPMMRGGGR